MTYLEHFMAHRTMTVSRWDRGRKLLSVAKLSAGGAVIAMSLAGVLAGIFFGSQPSFGADLAIASFGAIVTFVWLAYIFGVFRNPEH